MDKITVVNRRATFFSEVSELNNDTTGKLLNDFLSIGYIALPSSGFSFKLTPEGVISEEVKSLEFHNPTIGFRVSVGPGRLDINLNNLNNCDINFLAEVDKLSKIIFSRESLHINRLALGSIYNFNFSNEEKSAAYHAISGKANEDPIEWQIRTVTRSKFGYIENLQINNVVSVSRNLKMLQPEKEIDYISLELDINTTPLLDRGFTNGEICSFWEIAKESENSYFNKYYEILCQ